VQDSKDDAYRRDEDRGDEGDDEAKGEYRKTAPDMLDARSRPVSLRAARVWLMVKETPTMKMKIDAVR